MKIYKDCGNVSYLPLYVPKSISDATVDVSIKKSRERHRGIKKDVTISGFTNTDLPDPIYADRRKYSI